MSRVRFRKNTIFRIYLVCFAVFFGSSCVFLLVSQSRFHRRQLQDLRNEVSSLSSQLESMKTVQPESVSSVPFSPVEEKRKEELFWIEGTGTSRNWWYMDVVFVDGERFRYFLHLPPRKADLVGLHRRLSHDSLIHFREPEQEEESVFGI